MWWPSFHLPWSLSSKCLDPIRIVRSSYTFLLPNIHLDFFIFVIPRYILIAISEILASITGLEYAFTKAPKNMRSLVMACFLFMAGLSSVIGEIFVCKFYSSSHSTLLLIWMSALSNQFYLRTRYLCGTTASWQFLRWCQVSCFGGPYAISMRGKTSWIISLRVILGLHNIRTTICNNLQINYPKFNSVWIPPLKL